MENSKKPIIFTLGALFFAGAALVSPLQVHAEDLNKPPTNNSRNGHMYDGSGRGMMGNGYFGLGMMGDQAGCPFGSPDAKVDVKETKDGAVITVTGTNKTEISKIKKMAQIMKLQHEVTTETE